MLSRLGQDARVKCHPPATAFASPFRAAKVDLLADVLLDSNPSSRSPNSGLGAELDKASWGIVERWKERTMVWRLFGARMEIASSR